MDEEILEETPEEREKREFKEKLKSMRFNHKYMNKQPSVKKKVINEDTGRMAGYHTHHWDGRQDATVTPETKRLKMKVQDVD